MGAPDRDVAEENSMIPSSIGTPFKVTAPLTGSRSLAGPHPSIEKTIKHKQQYGIIQRSIY
jgi:hypothetical protein